MMAHKEEKEEKGKGKSGNKVSLEKLINEESDEPKDLGAELEFLERQIDKMEDDDPKLKDAIAKRRQLRRQQKLRSLEREIQRVRDGEDNGFFM